MIAIESIQTPDLALCSLPQLSLARSLTLLQQSSLLSLGQVPGPEQSWRNPLQLTEVLPSADSQLVSLPELPKL